jgi:hypothetical protein
MKLELNLKPMSEFKPEQTSVYLFFKNDSFYKYLQVVTIHKTSNFMDIDDPDLTNWKGSNLIYGYHTPLDQLCKEYNYFI